jgi:type IV pilus assembly protein PilA
MERQNGFSLIELLITIGIFLVIAALAIPSLLRSKMAANEASAVSSVRSVVTAQTAYSVTFPDVGFASSLSILGPSPGCSPFGQSTSTSACLIDEVLRDGKKSGYSFELSTGTAIPATSYSITADPITPGVSGHRHFSSDATGVIRFNLSTTATSADTPIS